LNAAGLIRGFDRPEAAAGVVGAAVVVVGEGGVLGVAVEMHTLTVVVVVADDGGAGVAVVAAMGARRRRRRRW
jgi:hypothetical protein